MPFLSCSVKVKRNRKREEGREEGQGRTCDQVHAIPPHLMPHHLGFQVLYFLHSL